MRESARFAMATFTLCSALGATGCGDDDRIVVLPEDAPGADLGPGPAADLGPDAGPPPGDWGVPDAGPVTDPVVVTNLPSAEFVNEWADGVDLGLRLTSFAIVQQESFSEPGERFVLFLGEVQNLSAETICQERAEVTVWAGSREVFVPDFPPQTLYGRGHHWVSLTSDPLIIGCVGAGETAYLYTNGTFPQETLSAITEVRFRWHSNDAAMAVPFEEVPAITGGPVDPFGTGSYRFEGTITNDAVQLHSPTAYVLVRSAAGYYVEQTFDNTFMEFPPFATHDYETLSIDLNPTDWDLFVSISESDLTDLSAYAAMAERAPLPAAAEAEIRATTAASRRDLAAIAERWREALQPPSLP